MVGKRSNKNDKFKKLNNHFIITSTSIPPICPKIPPHTAAPMVNINITIRPNPTAVIKKLNIPSVVAKPRKTIPVIILIRTYGAVYLLSRFLASKNPERMAKTPNIGMDTDRICIPQII